MLRLLPLNPMLTDMRFTMRDALSRNSSLPVPQTTPPLFRGGVVGPAHLTASPAFQGDMIRRYPAGAAGGLIWPGMSMH